MDYPLGNSEYRIRICDHVLDNVYGQIGLTEVETKIEKLPIFKRLHSISQLGLVNLIFPCALHTRYVHSIGVMHVASEMATRINSNMSYPFFDDSDIQIIRLAGMLHDIGHYPMSHNIEQAYKDANQSNKYDIESVLDNINYYTNCPDFLITRIKEEGFFDANDDDQTPDNLKLKIQEKFAKGFNGSENFHHEHVGSIIISQNKDIHNIVKNYFVLLSDPEHPDKKVVNRKFAVIKKGEISKEQFSEKEIDEITTKLLCAIGEIVRGNYQDNSDEIYPWLEKYSAMIQIIHSELDADNIDYLLRDATFSGTSYGIMDMGILLNTMKVSTLCDGRTSGEPKKYIVGIKKKGIGCVEQFYLNKFLSYSQMIYSKYVSVLEAMLLRIESSYIIPKDSTYNCDEFENIYKKEEADIKYLAFSDYYIIHSIFEMSNKLDMLHHLPKAIISHLANSSAFRLASDEANECVCTSLSNDEIIRIFEDNALFVNFINLCRQLKGKVGKDVRGTQLEADLFAYRFETYSLTKQIPIGEFQNMFLFDKMVPSLRFNFYYYRLGNGVPVLEKDKYTYKEKENQIADEDGLPKLCVDDSRSSLSNLYSMKFVSLRKYSVTDYAVISD